MEESTATAIESGTEEDLITFDDDEAIFQTKVGEASSTLAEMTLSPLKDSNSSNNGKNGPISPAVETSTELPETSIEAPTSVIPSSTKETHAGTHAEAEAEAQYTFQIKDVTDYSKATKVDSLDISRSDDSEGLLRGWSQDFDTVEECQDDHGKLNSNTAPSSPTFVTNTNYQPRGIDTQRGDKSQQNQQSEGMNTEKALKALKKASVAVTGTALVAAGIPLIAMPTPGGVIVSGSGLALLATEFPAAQRVLDKSRDGLEKMVGKEEDDDDDETDDDNDNEDGNHSRSNNNYGEGYAKLNTQPLSLSSSSNGTNSNNYDDASICCENASLVSSNKRSEKSISEQRIQTIEEAFKNAKETTKKTTKKTKKNVKRFIRGTILPLMSKLTTDKGRGGGAEGEKATDAESTRSTTQNKKGSISTNTASATAVVEGNQILDIPLEDFLSDKSLRNERKDNNNQNKMKSTPRNLEGAFPVRIPSENLLE